MDVCIPTMSTDVIGWVVEKGDFPWVTGVIRRGFEVVHKPEILGAARGVGILACAQADDVHRAVVE